MAGLRQTKGISLPELRDRIAGLRDPAFRAKLSQLLGEEARTQVADSFREERDPYGNKWAPLARPRARDKKGTIGKILQDTGRMAASVAVAPAPNGFRIDIPVKYAPVHQYGATIKPHQRGSGIIIQDARGRIVGKRGLARALKRGSLKGIKSRRFHAYRHGGAVIPRRQMLPEKDTGGLGPIWSAAFIAVTNRAVERQLRGR
jgi:phage virion morphogenesis protein